MSYRPWLLCLIALAMAILPACTPAVAQVQADQEQCVPLAKIEAQAAEAPGFTNFRKVDEKYVGVGNEIMEEVAPQIKHEWTAFYLINRADGGGVLFMGHDGTICRFMPFNQAHWPVIVGVLEGNGV